jgi:organic radical activating enzyme
MPVPATPGTDLYLKEVFSSLQGEGVLIGRRQLFVRLAWCNLACAYCDTDFAAGPVWSAEVEPGMPTTREYPNPVAPEELTRLLQGWQERFPAHHSLALTGGEPLLQSAALSAWLPVASRILPVYLETNGTLPEALATLLPYLTWISMDIKLAATAGAPTPWETHASFLHAGRPKICQVKLVVDQQTPDADLVEAARFVQKHGPGIPLVLQPRTVAGQPAVGGRRLLAMQAIAAGEHPDTLVIPQLHPFLSVR